MFCFEIFDNDMHVLVWSVFSKVDNEFYHKFCLGNNYGVFLLGLNMIFFDLLLAY